MDWWSMKKPASPRQCTDAEDGTLTLDVLANDTDVEGTQLTLQSFTQPANGTLTENAGVFTYNPNSNFNGADTFTYIVTDGDLNSNAATVTINVNAIKIGRAHV